jgi:hypothetical protein
MIMSIPISLQKIGDDTLSAIEEKAADMIVGYWVFSEGRCEISHPVAEKLIRILRSNGFVIGHVNVPAS